MSYSTAEWERRALESLARSRQRREATGRSEAREWLGGALLALAAVALLSGLAYGLFALGLR